MKKEFIFFCGSAALLTAATVPTAATAITAEGIWFPRAIVLEGTFNDVLPKYTNYPGPALLDLYGSYKEDLPEYAAEEIVFATLSASWDFSFERSGGVHISQGGSFFHGIKIGALPNVSMAFNRYETVNRADCNPFITKNGCFSGAASTRFTGKSSDETPLLGASYDHYLQREIERALESSVEPITEFEPFFTIRANSRGLPTKVVGGAKVTATTFHKTDPLLKISEIRRLERDLEVAKEEVQKLEALSSLVGSKKIFSVLGKIRNGDLLTSQDILDVELWAVEVEKPKKVVGDWDGERRISSYLEEVFRVGASDLPFSLDFTSWAAVLKKAHVRVQEQFLNDPPRSDFNEVFVLEDRLEFQGLSGTQKLALLEMFKVVDRYHGLRVTLERLKGASIAGDSSAFDMQMRHYEYIEGELHASINSMNQALPDFRMNVASDAMDAIDGFERLGLIGSDISQMASALYDLSSVDSIEESILEFIDYTARDVDTICYYFYQFCNVDRRVSPELNLSLFDFSASDNPFGEPKVTVPIDPVPVPASFVLLFSAFGFLVRFRRLPSVKDDMIMV